MTLQIQFDKIGWDGFSCESDYIPRIGDTFISKEWANYLNEKQGKEVQDYDEEETLYVGVVDHELKNGKITPTVTLMDERSFKSWNRGKFDL